MAIEAKAILLRKIEQQLSSEVTASDLGKVMSAVSDQLCGFDVEQQEEDTPRTDDMFDAYVSAMRIQGRSEKTISHYGYIIKRMMESAKVPTRDMTVYHLRRFLADEKKRGIADRTLENMRQIFSAYFNWLQREGLIEHNPTSNLGAIKYQKKVKITYSETDCERMRFSCKNLRDKVIVSFLMCTGCRISEMTQLNRNDVNLDSLECTVLGKGNKERKVFLDPVTAMWLREYLDSRTDSLPALFIGRASERLTPGGVRYMMKKLQIDSSVSHVHPHKFRRTLATNLIKRGMPIQEVAAILGHDKLDTTMQYIVLDNTEIKHSYRKYA